MARTKGSINKPKLMGVRLSDLNKAFLPDVVINISVEYASLLGVQPSQITPPQPVATSVVAPAPEKDTVKVTKLTGYKVS
ncbi:MAG: hypothetical protein EKK57_11445 [Proteobacteria bacterium]|nr:MAG: hypothetical protein EKK57_11445 [Pseudomonadota bacterium]